MSLGQIINIIFIVIGLCVSFAALYWKSRERKVNQWNESSIDFEMALRKMENYMIEMDKALDEFHLSADSAIKELDEKYQELMFLYSLIDEKKKEIVYSPAPIQAPEPKPAPAKAVKAAKRENRQRSSHPRRKEILNLSKQGLSVSEIAEELSLGQDMVKLILELGKAR